MSKPNILRTFLENHSRLRLCAVIMAAIAILMVSGAIIWTHGSPRPVTGTTGQNSSDDGGQDAPTSSLPTVMDPRAEAPAEATNPEEDARVSDAPPEAVGSDEPAVHDNPTPADSGRDNAVRAAVEPLVSPYGDGVAVVYTPVDAPDGGFAINGDERMRSASMIKTLIMATLLQREADGSISLGDSYTIRESDIVGGTGSVQSMGAGTRLSLSSLAELMISQSDNVATNVLIDRLGMGAVNDEGARLGLGQTVLARKMMDTTAAAAGRENYTSASDQARILRLVASGGLVSPEASQTALACLKEQEDSEGIAQGVPSGTVVAHKTGTLDSVRHDGAIVYGKRPYVLVIMTHGMSDGVANALMARVSRAVWDAA